MAEQIPRGLIQDLTAPRALFTCCETPVCWFMEVLSPATLVSCGCDLTTKSSRGRGAKENNHPQQVYVSSILCVWSHSGFQQRHSPNPFSPITHSPHPCRMTTGVTPGEAPSPPGAILGDICGPGRASGRQPCITAAAGGRDVRPDHQLTEHTGLCEGYLQADGMRSSAQLVCLLIHQDILSLRNATRLSLQ